RGASRSMQSVGLLTLAVFRGRRLYLAQCGPTHAFLITSGGVNHYHESDLSGRGLGLGRAANIRYHQVELSPEDMLLVSANPPPIWTAAMLNGLRKMSLDRVHLRLIHHIGPDLQAALVQAVGGSGNLIVLRPEPASTDRRLQKQSSEPPRKAPPSRDTVVLERTPSQKVTSPKEAPQPEDAAFQDVGRQQAVTQTADPQKKALSGSQAIEGLDLPKIKPKKERIVGPALLKIGQAVGVTLRQGNQAIKELTKRMLPDESLLAIPTSVMAFIAIAVPVVVVAIAATVYIQRGQGSKYGEHYLQAQYSADQALQLSEATALRTAWNTVISHLDEAESYQVTDDSQSMRNYAQTVLDNLDYVIRLPFQPALVDHLPTDAKIKRIIATEGDNTLYLLNATDGHVFRATRTDRGYTLDQEFICEPVPKPLIVGELVDIVPLPLDNPNNAAIMGMDGNGNLMQCIPGGKSPLTFQMPSPDMNWGTPLAFAMNAAGLYVLDPLTNAVWIFWINDEFSERPMLYFDEQIPPMEEVIDLTLNRDDLFLLHADGHMTACTFGYPTRCQDPAMINDLREGGANGPTIDNAVFSEIQFAPPPDPSLYLLEPETVSIYHFSVRLTFQHQYRSLNPLPEGPATAFSISANHQVFLAMGNQVFYSPLP
ncbi:MAG: hypothetical protein MUO62_06800, partial [Anaerolineales bacterium]|nr:hypothetical protein [Anaerolineales bacterium]